MGGREGGILPVGGGEGHNLIFQFQPPGGIAQGAAEIDAGSAIADAGAAPAGHRRERGAVCPPPPGGEPRIGAQLEQLHAAPEPEQHGEHAVAAPAVRQPQEEPPAPRLPQRSEQHRLRPRPAFHRARGAGRRVPRAAHSL